MRLRLAFLALGVEALKTVADQNPGLHSVCTGPIARFIVGKLGHSAIFLYSSGAGACASTTTTRRMCPRAVTTRLCSQGCHKAPTSHELRH